MNTTYFAPAFFSAEDNNPFDHVTPSLDVFGPLLANKLYLFLGGIWALAYIVAAAYLLIGIVKFISAKKVAHNPDAISDASKGVQIALIGICALSAVGVIFGAALWFGH